MCLATLLDPADPLNLVKNAIKFTPPGGEVRVRSYNRPEAEFLPTLVVEAARTRGSGSSPRSCRASSTFDQGDASVTRQFGGLGLGLAISRSLAEAHGGCLQAGQPRP
ncbi:MAG: ATP-binding protein [Isosphaeraceae bacterium]